MPSTSQRRVPFIFQPVGAMVLKHNDSGPHLERSRNPCQPRDRAPHFAAEG